MRPGRDWCEPFVPTVARSYLGARVAILSQRPWQSGSLAFWRCGDLRGRGAEVSYPCHRICTSRETVASMFASVVQVLDLLSFCVLVH